MFHDSFKVTDSRAKVNCFVFVTHFVTIDRNARTTVHRSKVTLQCQQFLHNDRNMLSESSGKFVFVQRCKVCTAFITVAKFAL